MKEKAGDLMVCNKFIAAQQSCDLRRHLDSAAPETSIGDIVTKFIGVYIDENLDLIEHIDFVKKKISGGIYALNSSKNFLSSANMRTLYYSLVHPYLLYGIILWGSAYKKYTHKLYVLQKKALRVMYNTT